MLEERRLRHGVEHDVRRGTGERIAAKRRAMITRLHRGRRFLRRDESADGHTAREALRERHDVRLHAVFLVGEELAAAADTRLNLVEDEQRVVFVAERAHLLKVAGRRRIDAALALDGLEHDGAGLLTHHLGERVNVIVGNVVKACWQRAEALMVVRLSRRRERRNRAAMEATQRRDDLRFLRVERMRVFARDLDGALVRLRTGVAEERPVESRELHEFRCGICLRLCIVEVRAVDHLACLTADGLNERRIGMAEHIDGDAAEEVEVFVPIHIIGIGSFAVVENDLVTAKDRQVVHRILSKNLLIYFTHKFNLSYLTTCVPMP